MRTRFYLVSITVLIAACSQDNQPTSPVRGRSDVAPNSANTSTAPTTDGAKAPQAKPIDQVGFTKVTLVTGAPVTVDAGKVGGEEVQCPAGSIPTGGGFRILDQQTVPVPPIPFLSEPNNLANPTGWVVAVTNRAPGAVTSTVTAYVLCAS